MTTKTNPFKSLSLLALLALLTFALLPAFGSAEEKVYETKNGDSFVLQSYDEEDGDFTAQVRSGSWKGTIVFDKSGKATWQMRFDSSRFRFENRDDIPKPTVRKGTYNWDTNEFKFGLKVYKLKKKP